MIFVSVQRLLTIPNYLPARGWDPSSRPVGLNSTLRPTTVGYSCKCESHIKIPPKVSIGNTSSLNRGPANRRALGYVLLLIIGFGASVETVHSHGTGSPDRNGVAIFSDADGSHSSHTGRSPLTECSICAFQQQLSHGLVHAPLFAITPLAQTAPLDTPTLGSPSTSITRQSGRAPPLG